MNCKYTIRMHIFCQCNKYFILQLNVSLHLWFYFYAETELLLIILAQMDTFQH